MLRSMSEAANGRGPESTYIGATNDAARRLRAHNNNNKAIKRVGAKRTQGRTWMHVVIVSGFIHKRAALSFESGWRRLSQRRANGRLAGINSLVGSNLRYTLDPKYNRILDLLYFAHSLTVLDEKFAINYDLRLPIIQPAHLTIRTCLADWIRDLPWPPFVSIIQA